MKKSLFWTMGLILSLGSIAFFSTACDDGNNEGFSGGGFGNINTSVIDFAIGDGDRNRIIFFFDILAFQPTDETPFPEPDLLLDGMTLAGISSPEAMGFVGDDFFSCDDGSNEVQIWRDYQNLAENAAPDAVLVNGGNAPEVDSPRDCIVSDNRFFIANNNSNTVEIVQDFDAISGNDPAGLSVTVLNQAGSLITEPHSLFVSGEDLAVANEEFDTDETDPCVAIFRDVSTLGNGDAPDVNLSHGTSFYTLNNGTGNSAECIRVSVDDDDILYVATEFDTDLFLFNDFSGLSSNDLPDTILTQTTSRIDQPTRPVIATHPITGAKTLWFGNENDDVEGGALFGAVGYFMDSINPQTGTLTNGNGLVQAQAPDIALNHDLHGIQQSFGLLIEGGALIHGGSSTEDDDDPGIVNIYHDVYSMDSNTPPNLVIPGFPFAGDYEAVDALAATVRP